MRIIKASRGTIDEMLNAFSNRISELDKGIASSTDEIENCEDSDFESITSSDDFTSFFVLTDEQEDKLNEIAERYNVSKPVSGDWSTETVHEQKAISDEFGIDMDAAKELMVDYLGFDESHFDDSEVTSSTDYDDEEYLYDELQYGPEAGYYDTNYMTRLSDHVCDRMLDEFGAYMEAIVYPDCIEFTCYEDESANSVVFEDVIFGDELDFVERDMAPQISMLCNRFWDKLAKM